MRAAEEATAAAEASVDTADGFGGGKPGREVAGKHPLIGRGKQGRMYRLLPR